MTAVERNANVLVNVLRLLTFGGLAIERDDRPAAPRLRPPRIALLAVLASAGERGVARERVASLFWPESDEGHARNSLRQLLHGLRSDLGAEVIRTSGSTIALDSAALSADVTEFRKALALGAPERAVALVSGPFLDGFYVPGAAGFERWAEEERARIAGALNTALLSLAADAAKRGDRDGVVEWWRRLSVSDPLSGRFALGYLKALAMRGDRAEALAFARQHEAVVRRELEADPDPEIRRLVAELRGASPELITTVDGSRLRAAVSPSASAPSSDVMALPNAPSGTRRTNRTAVLAAVLVTVAIAVVGGMRRWFGPARPAPTLAVGFIREEGVPDSFRVGRVITDMLATNLARIDGLAVLANSRLLEIMKPGQDSSVGYTDAARRAGATDLLEGRLLVTPHAVLALEMRRVELKSGIVKEVYRVNAIDRFALVDSLTQAIARRYKLPPPGGSVAEATTSSPLAYRFYEEGLRAYLQSDIKSAQRLMHVALQEDSTFAMAAYYEVLLAVSDGDVMPDGRHIADARRNALRLAARAPERERLTITATLLQQEMNVNALAVAESLAAKYGNDPRAFINLGTARSSSGDWRGSAEALEHAIALDSAGETTRESNCRLCQDLGLLAGMYFWWDSLPAAERTARRYLRISPTAWWPHWVLAQAAARGGDSAAAYASYRRFRNAGGGDPSWKLSIDLLLEDYEELARDVRPFLASALKPEWNTGVWSLVIALRNQGRIRDAWQLVRTGRLEGFPRPVITPDPPDDFNQAILAFEGGDPKAAAAVFRKRLTYDMTRWAPGYRARHLAWNGALAGIGLAAIGDTISLKPLADSVERWGLGSSYGRDRKAHHFLRGHVLAAAGRHADAAREFQNAIYSPSFGFTRANYELAKCQLKIDRPREAVAALQPALRGEVDASNLYITRTDLHELLAQAFDQAHMPDSAATHYRAVLKAWRQPDAIFQSRRDAAQNWLAHHAAVVQRSH